MNYLIERESDFSESPTGMFNRVQRRHCKNYLQDRIRYYEYKWENIQDQNQSLLAFYAKKWHEYEQMLRIVKSDRTIVHINRR